MKRIKSMLRLLVLLALCPIVALGQADTGCHLRVSLLTVSVGDEIYAAFGHTGIRMTDSSTGKDIVYNYGTFNGYEEGFELKFMRGKLMYYISSESFQNFIGIYVEEQRKVEEQELYIPQAARRDLLNFLVENERGDNKYYKYDFLFDNCATRIRDAFPKAIGNGFKYGRVIPANATETYRQIINRYLKGVPWERLGINLLLGKPVDKVMNNEGIMFLPDYLRDGMAEATINGNKAVSPTLTLLDVPNSGAKASTRIVGVPGTAVPMLVLLLVAILTSIGLFVKRLRRLGKIMSTLLMIVTGLLGCLMAFMWLGTDHEATKGNWNVLWCLPTNLLVPFIGRRGKDRYALIALGLLVVAVIMHLIHFQELPARDVWPLWVAIGLVFGTIYRQGKPTLPA